jgi:hypothetical protein
MGTRIRPKKPTTSPPATPVETQPGIRVLICKQNIRIGFVITELDIVRRPVGLDEVLLEQQCLRFAPCHGDVDLMDLVDHRQSLAGKSGTTKIAPNPILQIAGFSHIDHFAILPQHLIDTRASRQIFQEMLVVKCRFRLCRHES